MNYQRVSHTKKYGVGTRSDDAYGGATTMIVTSKQLIHRQEKLAAPAELEGDLVVVVDNPFELRFQLPDLRDGVKDLVKTREVGEFLSGAIAGAMTKAIIAPLETIRTRLVVGVGSKHISGSFLEIIEQQGWQGLWAGNAINMLRTIPTQAIELGTFECVKRVMISAQEKWDATDRLQLRIGPVSLNLSPSWISPFAVAGAAAGIVSTIACHPLEVLKDRLTVSPEIYPSWGIAVHKIYKEGGIGALYAGLSPTMMGMLPYSTCYYYMYETMKKSYCSSKNKSSLNRPEMLLLGALAGEKKSAHFDNSIPF